MRHVHIRVKKKIYQWSDLFDEPPKPNVKEKKQIEQNGNATKPKEKEKKEMREKIEQKSVKETSQAQVDPGVSLNVKTSVENNTKPSVDDEQVRLAIENIVELKRSGFIMEIEFERRVEEVTTFDSSHLKLRETHGTIINDILKKIDKPPPEQPRPSHTFPVQEEKPFLFEQLEEEAIEEHVSVRGKKKGKVKLLSIEDLSKLDQLWDTEKEMEGEVKLRGLLEDENGNIQRMSLDVCLFEFN